MSDFAYSVGSPPQHSSNCFQLHVMMAHSTHMCLVIVVMVGVAFCNVELVTCETANSSKTPHWGIHGSFSPSKLLMQHWRPKRCCLVLRLCVH